MADASSRRRFLGEAGRLALQGLVSAVRGVDLVIDPNAPAAPAAGAPSPVVVAAAPQAALPAPPLSLVRLAGAAPGLVETATGLAGEVISPVGNLEVEATARDLAWLPLSAGFCFYQRLGAGRMLAVGGYRRAALVRFGPGGGDLWCTPGDETLTHYLPAPEPGHLLLEEPRRLWRGIRQGQVRRALLGGAALDRALALPGAAAEPLSAGWERPWLPVWGLFSSGRELPVQAVEAAHWLLLPTAGLPCPPSCQAFGW